MSLNHTNANHELSVTSVVRRLDVNHLQRTPELYTDLQRAHYLSSHVAEEYKQLSDKTGRHNLRRLLINGTFMLLLPDYLSASKLHHYSHDGYINISGHRQILLEDLWQHPLASQKHICQHNPDLRVISRVLLSYGRGDLCLTVITDLRLFILQIRYATT